MIAPDEILQELEKGVPNRTTLAYIQGALFEMSTGERQKLKEQAAGYLSVDQLHAVFGCI